MRTGVSPPLVVRASSDGAASRTPARMSVAGSAGTAGALPADRGASEPGGSVGTVGTTGVTALEAPAEVSTGLLRASSACASELGKVCVMAPGPDTPAFSETAAGRATGPAVSDVPAGDAGASGTAGAAPPVTGPLASVSRETAGSAESLNTTGSGCGAGGVAAGLGCHAPDSPGGAVGANGSGLVTAGSSADVEGIGSARRFFLPNTRHSLPYDANNSCLFHTLDRGCGDDLSLPATELSPYVPRRLDLFFCLPALEGDEGAALP